MLIYVFTLDGEPGFRTGLHQAQAVMEEKIRDRRDVSDVWWSDDNPYIPRVYLYGGSHADYEAAQAGDYDAEISWEEDRQLIWPMEVPDPVSPVTPLDQLGPVVVQLSMTVSYKEGTRTITRGFSDQHWPGDAKGRADCLKSFTRDVEWILINEWIKEKEGS